MSQLYTYSPKDILAVFGEIPLIYGFSDQFFTIERLSPLYTTKAGLYGKVARIRTSDNSARITFSCSKQSITNDLLSAHLTADQLSPGGIGVVPFMLKELTNLTTFVAARAYIENWPRIVYTTSIETVEWSLIAEDLKIFIGGQTL